MVFDKIRRLMAVLLAGSLLSGCATQKIQFASVPLGATVEVAGKRRITPCTLRIPENATHATFRLPSGEEKRLSLPKLDSDWVEARDAARSATGGTLKVAGLSVGLVGLGLMILSESCDDDDDGGWDEEPDNDELFAAGGLAFVGGVLTYGVGEMIEPDREGPVLCAEFLGADEPRYEDRGFGAKRLKSVAP